jgi:hypothetical protein
MRCEGVTKFGQCNNEAVEGTQFCPSHGGVLIKASRERRELQNYRVELYKERLTEKLNTDKQFNLREEVCIMRVMLETKMESITNDIELICAAPEIADMITKIDKLVISAQKLEAVMGQFLDKQQLLDISTKIVQILSTEITDELLLERVAYQIGRLIGREIEEC